MAELKDKVTHALDEARLLILGAQVLLGFGLRGIFEKGFEQLPEPTRYLLTAGVGLMVVAVALLMSPTAYHRIVTEGEDTNGLHRFTSRVMTIAIAPFAVSLGISLYAAVEKVAGQTAGIIAGASVLAVALFFWYGLAYLRRRQRGKSVKMGNEEEGKTELKDKIKHVLTEARMVLPGVQALLGFQFAVMLVEAFDQLPDSSKYIHLISFGLIAFTTILLISPAAYHRIVEEGEDTEEFHRFASRMILASMVPLALGISGDLYVVVRKVTESESFAITTAAIALLFFYGLWFGYTAFRRNQQPAR